MPGTKEAVYVEAVRQAITAINPAVTEAAVAHGWPAALDAVSTIFMSLLIAAVGPDEARSACGRMYEDVARLKRAAAGPTMDEKPRGRA